MRLPIWIPILGALAIGCAASSETESKSAQPTPEAKTETTEPKTMEESKDQIAVIKTNYGTIKFKFLTKKAPETVANFVKLAKKGFYDGTRFHRVIPGFMIQGGDPNSKKTDRSIMGTGGPGYQIKAEFNDTHHARGIVSMARSSDPDSAGSQFFICVDEAGFLDGQYTAFGEVIEGMDVVDKIVHLDRDSNDNPLEDKKAVMDKVTIEESK
ncbi:MAG TPA: peptidylprolyl isomerase [Fimbriimonadaceae bacterium]|nr:peptidylprolyl isomerase [Fimbriimonadaceae bacterium]